MSRADDIARLSPAHREYVRDELAKRSKRPSGLVSAATPTTDYDSDAERRYAQLLDALARSSAHHWDGSTVLGWVHHSQKFLVGVGKFYTPDFAITVCLPSPLSGGPRCRYVEVKGSWESKNARESRSKLCAAALLYPWFEWEAALVNGSGFDHEVIGSR